METGNTFPSHVPVPDVWRLGKSAYTPEQTHISCVRHAMQYFKTEYSENHTSVSSIDTCAHVKNQTRELLVRLRSSAVIRDLCVLIRVTRKREIFSPLKSNFNFITTDNKIYFNWRCFHCDYSESVSKPPESIKKIRHSHFEVLWLGPWFGGQTRFRLSLSQRHANTSVL